MHGGETRNAVATLTDQGTVCGDDHDHEAHQWPGDWGSPPPLDAVGLTADQAATVRSALSHATVEVQNAIVLLVIILLGMRARRYRVLCRARTTHRSAFEPRMAGAPGQPRGRGVPLASYLQTLSLFPRGDREKKVPASVN